MLKKLLNKDDGQRVTKRDEFVHGDNSHGAIRDRLADSVFLIATHNPHAKHVIVELHKDGIVGESNDVKVGFGVYNNFAQGERCECWFELEYCDFIHGRDVDEDMLKRTCDNIRRGMCTHVSESTDKTERAESYVRLLHIAAGSSNKEIVKLLLKLITDAMYSPSAYGMRPFHVALTKSCTTVITYLVDVPRHWWENDDSARFHDCDVVLAKRVKESGKVVIQPAYKMYSNVINFIHMSDDANADLIRKVVSLFKSTYKACDLLKCLLSTGKEHLAFHFLQETKREGTKNGWYLVIYCVLVNDRDCLRVLLKRDIPFLDRHLKSLGYNLLDIAKAFGSASCYDVLKSTHQLTDGIYQKLSPYTFLFKFAADSYGMDPGLTVRLISKLHSLRHDINHQDELKMTPLLYAIALLSYHKLVIHELLSLGADIDAKDRNGRTPLCSAITPYNSPLGSKVNSGPRALMKDLLFFNPDIRCSTNQNAVFYAAEGDLQTYSYLRFMNANSVEFKAASIEADSEDVEAKTYEERFIALSRVALLYEFGFVISSKSLQYSAQKHHLQIMSDYLNKLESTPRTLQSSCRLVIRKACPGRLLHRVIEKSQLPKRLQNYVVKPYILRYVDIEVANSDGTKEIIHVDH